MSNDHHAAGASTAAEKPVAGGSALFFGLLLMFVGGILFCFGVKPDTLESPKTPAQGALSGTVDNNTPFVKRAFAPPEGVTGGTHQIKPGQEKGEFTLQPGQWAKLSAAGDRPYKVTTPDGQEFRVMLQNGSILPEGDYIWDTKINRTIHVQGMAVNEPFEFFYK